MKLYKTALGIEIGDIVTTSYGSGPYKVISLTAPRHVFESWQYLAIRALPVTSLRCRSAPGHHLYPGGGPYYLNDVRRMPDGRYFDDVRQWGATENDELFFQKPAQRQPMQIDMFASYLEPDAPYVFQDGVNYDAGDGKVWHCRDCKRDFNGQRDGMAAYARCPYCPRRWMATGIPIFVWRYTAGEDVPTECLRSMNLPG